MVNPKTCPHCGKPVRLRTPNYPNLVSLGEAIARIRYDQGLTQAEVGRRMVPPRTYAHVCQIESGDVKIGESLVERLADAMGVPLAEFGHKLGNTVSVDVPAPIPVGKGEGQ